jgi:signal transduction histidine kinase
MQGVRTLVNLKMSHKGLILVGFPLVFELLFVGMLWSLLNQAESETQREYRSKLVIAEVDSLKGRFMEQAATATIYATTQSQPLWSKFEQQSNEISKQLDQLMRGSAGNAKKLELLKAVSEKYNQEHQLIVELKQGADEGGREFIFMRGIDLPQELANLIRQVKDLMAKFVALEHSEQSPDAAERSRMMVKVSLAVGVVLNVLIAVALALLFNKVQASRLDVLVDNTDRMAHQLELNPRLEGEDELGHLDKVFHEMADGLAQVEKMKKEFVAMISHDLRAPLSALQMFLSNLADGMYGELNEAGGRRGQNALKSVAQLMKLINDLLDMEKLEAGRMEMNFKVTELTSIVEYSMDAVRNLAEGNEVNLEYEDKKASITADGDRLAQVVINLLSNAIKFSPKGGTVRVKVEFIGDQVKVSIDDEGSGVPAQYRDMIFERFKQLPGQKKGGTGLGLPICKAIIEQHAGTIGVDSEEGKGSSFWFIIPVERKGAQSAAATGA